MLQLGSGQWFTVDFCYGFILSFLFLLDLSEVWRVHPGSLMLSSSSSVSWLRSLWVGLLAVVLVDMFVTDVVVVMVDGVV